MFCEVERSYIEDGFNLYGLRACVSNFSDCLDLILDRIGPDDSDDSHLTQSACTLYGLIHARYIITAHGLDAMYSKVSNLCVSVWYMCVYVPACLPAPCTPSGIPVVQYLTHSLSLSITTHSQYAAKDFGSCPLVQCAGQPALPVGLKDEMGADAVKIYCPKCHQVYHPPPVRSRASNGSGVDGAAFGTTFPHLFLMTFSNLVPDPLPVQSTYVPRVFGFRVHKTARQRTSPAVAAAAASAAVVVVVAQKPAAAVVPATPQAIAAVAAVPVVATPQAAVVPVADGATAAAATIPAAAVDTQKDAAMQDGDLGDDKKKSRTGKRTKKDASSVNGNASPAAPTFLMENPVKRRRTKNGSA